MKQSPAPRMYSSQRKGNGSDVHCPFQTGLPLACQVVLHVLHKVIVKIQRVLTPNAASTMPTMHLTLNKRQNVAERKQITGCL